MTRMPTISAAAAFLLAACAAEMPAPTEPPVISAPAAEFYGTLEPFADHAVYFVITDRFVDGDVGNNHVGQGGTVLGTFDRPIRLEGRLPANIGYLGGDFRGLADNAGYIADMGFGAVWITPIVDNPDEAFTGGLRPGEGLFTDRGKTGYHGYWGVNFFKVDEHLESPGLAFRDLARTLDRSHDLELVLDIVCNHGSPAYTMPEDQPKYGEIYDAGGRLIADHQNLHPTELDPDNPLHAFYRREPDLAELSDMDWENPDVLEYFVAAYLKWIDEGAAAFRIDTIRHMPHTFWKSFTDRIRAEHPGFFMFGESFDFEASSIAEHTWTENGGVSVLDFPGQRAMNAVFAGDAPYTVLASYLHLDTGVYQNPYELMTFYDNHDMPRMNADDEGFIDAHNWLFTSRGIPVVYYGSETAFRAGTDQHGGNRDYYGQDNIDAARTHPVQRALRAVANLRRNSIALRRGLQLDLAYTADTAAFFRVYQKDGVNETALVLLNGGDAPAELRIGQPMQPGPWIEPATGRAFEIDAGTRLVLTVPAHGVRVLVSDRPVEDPGLLGELGRLQQARLRRP